MSKRFKKVSEDEFVPTASLGEDPANNPTIFEIDDEGRIYQYDCTTGEVISEVKNVPARRLWKYTDAHGELICEKLCEGKTLTDICKMPGMPSIGTLARWRSMIPELDAAIKEAKKFFAELCHDTILEGAFSEGMEMTRDEIAAEKLRFDKLKWAAKVNNPEQYGDKMKYSGDGENPIEYVISTGVKRGAEDAKRQGDDQRKTGSTESGQGRIDQGKQED